MISYLPVCGQENRCIALGIKFLHRNQINCKLQPSMIRISQAPVAVGRIKGDGNVFFFKSIAQNLTGLQEDHMVKSAY